MIIVFIVSNNIVVSIPRILCYSLNIESDEGDAIFFNRSVRLVLTSCRLLFDICHYTACKWDDLFY